ncbi:IPExxxVDY family protein [Mucilaginibacter arboris]|uniref:IPExxxVDY family protein n=1 Tax=Mucilaginibacter arboris TaxID=2682090 RepID=A0A7K1SV97_9SPHI|nr:IPExxxVDY family protein [Mucilaginibacter arboris]MVN21245.1 IPExxxVDY family protein [Mucilaginibacter arboris]
MSRKILNFELDLDFILIAITSHLRDYRLCYHINKELNSDFRKISDYCLDLFAGNEPLQFSQYFYKIEASETEFYIICNKSMAGYLIPEMGEVNYFMLVKNHFDQEDLDNTLFRLKHIKDIEAVKQVNPKAIKSNENLLF